MFSADPYANRFLFTGREFLKEANLYDYRNRVYSAELGRFLQTDPIRFEAGDVNLYRYVGNKFGVFVDPFGLEEKCCPEGKWSGRGTYVGAGAIIGFGWFHGEMKCDSDSSYKAYVKGRMWPFGITVGVGINSLDLSVSGAKKKSDLVGQTGVFFDIGFGKGVSVAGGSGAIEASVGPAIWGWKITKAD
jgi:RHS repeat-associated protein